MVLFTLSILCFALILTLLTFYVSTKAKINKVDSSQVQEIHRFLCHYFYFFILITIIMHLLFHIIISIIIIIIIIHLVTSCRQFLELEL